MHSLHLRWTSTAFHDSWVTRSGPRSLVSQRLLVLDVDTACSLSDRDSWDGVLCKLFQVWTDALSQSSKRSWQHEFSDEMGRVFERSHHHRHFAFRNSPLGSVGTHYLVQLQNQKYHLHLPNQSQHGDDHGCVLEKQKSHTEEQRAVTQLIKKSAWLKNCILKATYLHWQSSECQLQGRAGYVL